MCLPHLKILLWYQKNEGRPVGCVGYHKNGSGNLELGEDEAEIGYWIGVPYWGQGLIPEAAAELVRFLFEDIKLNRLWCCSSTENKKSRRVWEKCGFIYHHTEEDKFFELVNETRSTDFACLAKADWRG